MPTANKTKYQTFRKTFMSVVLNDVCGMSVRQNGCRMIVCWVAALLRIPVSLVPALGNGSDVCKVVALHFDMSTIGSALHLKLKNDITLTSTFSQC